MEKKLLITADDFGVHDSIDKGIIACIDRIDCIDVIVTHHTSEDRIKKLLKWSMILNCCSNPTF